MNEVAACFDCRRRHSKKDRPIDGVQTCAAYPMGIPADILGMEVNHRDPHEGDNGLRFVEGPPQGYDGPNPADENK